MFEFEKKVLLSVEEYLALVRISGKGIPTVVQTNYYYDSDNFEMNAKGITCRVREKNGKYTATIKSRISNTTECSIETSQEILNMRENNLFGDMDIKLQGSLTTVRTIIYSDKYVEAVMDKNTYLGYTDYELEIEYLSGNEQQSEKLLNDLARALHSYDEKIDIVDFCNRRKTFKTKSERFFERKKSLKLQKESYNQ